MASPDILKLAHQLADFGIDGTQKVHVDASSGGDYEKITEIPITVEPSEHLPFPLFLKDTKERRSYSSAHPYVIVSPKSTGRLTMDLVIQPKKSYFLSNNQKTPTHEERERDDAQRKAGLEAIRQDMVNGQLPTFFDHPTAYIRLNVNAPMSSEALQFINGRKNYNHLNFAEEDVVALADRLGFFEAVARARNELETENIRVTFLGPSWGQSWGPTSGSISFGLHPTFEVSGVDPLIAIGTVYRHFYQIIASRYPGALEIPAKPGSSGIGSAFARLRPKQIRSLWDIRIFRREATAELVRREYQRARAQVYSTQKPIRQTFEINTDVGVVKVGGYVEYQSPNSF
jgi:hypothetical protein